MKAVVVSNLSGISSDRLLTTTAFIIVALELPDL